MGNNTKFKAYRSAGMCVIPLRGGRPLVEWSRYFEALPEPVEVATWSADEMAILCGKVSGVVAVDIDTDDGAARIYQLAGATTVRKRGSKGFTAFYRWSGERSCAWKRDGKVVCELLSDKRLTTIPPSPHRVTGVPYEWMDGNGLLDVESLPALPDDFCTIMDALFPRPVRVAPAVVYDRDFDEVSLNEAAEMLDYISSDCPRDEWITIGMGLRDEFGDAACNLWHDWSARAGKRYNRADAQSCWRSFDSTGVTIATIVQRARAGGWLPRPKKEAEEEPEDFKVYFDYVAALAAPQQKEEEAPNPEIAIGGLVGRIADWITETAIIPQPVLSLAAAISFVGMMKGRRVRGVRNLRTNVLCMSLAPTAAGKEHPQQAIDALAEACGLGQNMMGRPTSGTALLTGLNKAGCRAMLSIDELGRFLGNIAMKSAGGYQREIVDYIIELYGRSGGTFRGRQYANEKLNPQVILEQPHLCVLGSTIPERLQAACTSDEIVDGFLNRWLVFATSQRPEKQKGKGLTTPPGALVDEVNSWLARHEGLSDHYGKPEPAKISMTPEAWDVFCDFENQMKKKLDSEPYPQNMLYARADAHVEKLAMILADNGIIGLGELSTAIGIVSRSNMWMLNFVSGIHGSDHERNVMFVLDTIRRAGGSISRNVLTQQTRRLTNRDRKDIVEQLIESEQLFVNRSGKKVTLFLRNV